MAKAVAELKEQPGKNLVVLGSGKLVQIRMENDLVDEYGLSFNPIVLGSGCSGRVARRDPCAWPAP